MIKHELRKIYKAKRMELAPGELNRASEEITECILRSFQLEGKTISLFLPIERHGEINTYAILERAFSIGAHIGLPISDFETGELKHRLYEATTTLTLNEYGIPEPVSGKIIKPHEFDYVLVPLLIADESGHRVGYGKGFYDKFLKKCAPTCKFIGLSIFEPIVQISDLNSDDVPLHYIVTPTHLIEI